MKLHRFYVGDHIALEHSVWINDKNLLHQWSKVLRIAVGSELVLFDGKSHDRLYKVTKFEPMAAHLEYVTDFERNVPTKNTYLFWSLLKKDKNDWVLQKCTELGVSHFVPVLAERSEKIGFRIDRAQKIITEAAEQCGRSDIPTVREPMLLQSVIEAYQQKIPLVVCEQGEQHQTLDTTDIGLLVGPEGGWSDAEKSLFADCKLKHLHMSQFTLRAETAAVVAAATQQM